MRTVITFRIEVEKALSKEECDEILLTLAAKLKEIKSLKDCQWKAKVTAEDDRGDEYSVGILSGE